jgi:hypothetical protein
VGDFFASLIKIKKKEIPHQDEAVLVVVGCFLSEEKRKEVHHEQLPQPPDFPPTSPTHRPS